MDARESSRDMLGARRRQGVGLHQAGHGITRIVPLVGAHRNTIGNSLTKEYPLIQAMAEQGDAEIHWGDQNGINRQDQVGRGRARQGSTAVIRTNT